MPCGCHGRDASHGRRTGISLYGHVLLQIAGADRSPAVCHTRSQALRRPDSDVLFCTIVNISISLYIY